MKKLKVRSILGFIFSIFMMVHSAYGSPTTYYVPQVIPGHTADIFLSGALIGGIKDSVTFSIPKNKSALQILGEESQRSKAEADAYLESRKEQSLNRLTVQSLEKEPKKENVVIEHNESLKINPVIFDLKSFSLCATNTAKILRSAWVAFNQKDTKSSEKLLNSINAERGDGRQVTASGMPCGKYAGKFGFLKLDLKEELKLMMVFKNRNEEQTKILLSTWYLARQPDVKLMAWKIFWSRLSFLSILGENNLPSIQGVDLEIGNKYLLEVLNEKSF